MKFIKRYEGNASGQPTMYEFHTNIDELKLLQGLLKNYTLHGPKGEDWNPNNARANNMLKAFQSLTPIRNRKEI